MQDSHSTRGRDGTASRMTGGEKTGKRMTFSLYQRLMDAARGLVFGSMRQFYGGGISHFN
ncbi:hypothetical protein [Burkholderia ambifaria]|uniref:hypothetical protein n=1 Tax=Burkholderia ambifaria TaxID=152480 RepID=UPI0018E0ADFC|nr:hypothetical protein [Burkholderia ambifaria]